MANFITPAITNLQNVVSDIENRRSNERNRMLSAIDADRRFALTKAAADRQQKEYDRKVLEEKALGKYGNVMTEDPGVVGGVISDGWANKTKRFDWELTPEEEKAYESYGRDISKVPESLRKNIQDKFSKQEKAATSGFLNPEKILSNPQFKETRVQQIQRAMGEAAKVNDGVVPTSLIDKLSQAKAAEISTRTKAEENQRDLMKESLENQNKLYIEYLKTEAKEGPSTSTINTLDKEFRKNAIASRGKANEFIKELEKNGTHIPKDARKNLIAHTAKLAEKGYDKEQIDTMLRSAFKKDTQSMFGLLGGPAQFKGTAEATLQSEVGDPTYANINIASKGKNSKELLKVLSGNIDSNKKSYNEAKAELERIQLDPDKRVGLYLDSLVNGINDGEDKKLGDNSDKFNESPRATRLYDTNTLIGQGMSTSKEGALQQLYYKNPDQFIKEYNTLDAKDKAIVDKYFTPTDTETSIQKDESDSDNKTDKATVSALRKYVRTQEYANLPLEDKQRIGQMLYNAEETKNQPEVSEVSEVNGDTRQISNVLHKAYDLDPRASSGLHSTARGIASFMGDDTTDEFAIGDKTKLNVYRQLKSQGVETANDYLDLIDSIPEKDSKSHTVLKAVHHDLASRNPEYRKAFADKQLSSALDIAGNTVEIALLIGTVGSYGTVKALANDKKIAKELKEALGSRGSQKAKAERLDALRKKYKLEGVNSKDHSAGIARGRKKGDYTNWSTSSR